MNWKISGDFYLYIILLSKYGHIGNFINWTKDFTNKNKYAIIEYIRDLLRLPLQNFKIIVLTHNFDFYRTLSSRLNLKKAVLMATKNESGEIELLEGLYTTQDVFKQNLQLKIFCVLLGVFGSDNFRRWQHVGVLFHLCGSRSGR